MKKNNNIIFFFCLFLCAFMIEDRSILPCLGERLLFRGSNLCLLQLVQCYKVHSSAMSSECNNFTF